MPRLGLNTDWIYRGLRVITLENEILRIQILPEAGAKIWQITYLPLGADLLWNNPRIAPAKHAIHTRYDDVWSGGWDELFPNDNEAMVGGERYPDHGELWSGSWDVKTFRTDHEVGVTLQFQTPITAIAIEKTIILRPGEARAHFTHRFTNDGPTACPFLWKLHPAFKVTPDHRLDFPPMKVVREPAFPGTLAGAPQEFAWPYASVNDRNIDLRKVRPHDERQLYFFYGTELQSGWCALTNTVSRLACGLKFDPKIFSSCWLFASYGGWRNYDVAVLEPCTGYPLNFDDLIDAGRHRVLAPAESLSTDVLFTVQEDVAFVTDIREDGVIMSSARIPASTRFPL